VIITKGNFPGPLFPNRQPKSEAWVKARCKEIFADFGNDHPYMPSANMYGGGGAADFIECMNGYYIAVECKRKGNTQTKLQKIFQEGIESRGGMYLLIYEDNIEDLRNVLAEWRYAIKS
jgi:hypothetical protein